MDTHTTYTEQPRTVTLAAHARRGLIGHFADVVKHVHDQCSIFSTVQKFCPDYGLLLRLPTFTSTTHSYALLPPTKRQRQRKQI